MPDKARRKKLKDTGDVSTYTCDHFLALAINNSCYKSETLQCDLCKTKLGKEGFPDSAWTNKSMTTQRTLCNTCCRPPCAEKHCWTCPACRGSDPQCSRAKRNCTSPVAPLHPKQLLTTLEELSTWRCAGCKQTICTDCGRAMPDKARRKKLKCTGDVSTYTCGQCLTLAINRQRLRQQR